MKKSLVLDHARGLLYGRLYSRCVNVLSKVVWVRKTHTSPPAGERVLVDVHQSPFLAVHINQSLRRVFFGGLSQVSFLEQRWFQADSNLVRDGLDDVRLTGLLEKQSPCYDATAIRSAGAASAAGEDKSPLVHPRCSRGGR